MSIRLVCFDLDGTLIREIHSAMLPCLLNGKEREHAAIQAREESGQLDYVEADYLRARLFKGLDEKRIGECFLDIVKPLNCIAETVQRLHDRGMKCIVVTVGPKQVAKAAAEIWGFDSYCGSNYETVNGKFTGEITEYIDAGGKVDCLIGYCAGEMIQPHECAAVGDGPTDVPVFGYCLKSIAINASAEVAEKAAYSINTENLSDILGFIA